MSNVRFRKSDCSRAAVGSLIDSAHAAAQRAIERLSSCAVQAVELLLATAGAILVQARPEAAQLTPSPSSEPARMGIAAAATAMTWGSLLKAIASWRRSASATPIRVRQLTSVMMPVISADRRASPGLPCVAQHCQHCRSVSDRLLLGMTGGRTGHVQFTAGFVADTDHADSVQQAKCAERSADTATL